MLFGIPGIYIWAGVIIVSLVAEALTLNLTAMWFAVGGFAALLAASAGMQLWLQTVLFVLFSVIFLLLVRPFCRKFLRTKEEPTNADRIIGEAAIVTLDIDNIHNSGEIRVFGQIWTARSADNTEIPAGAAVKVIAIRGVKAIVERV